MTAKQLQQLLQFLRYPTDLIHLIEFHASLTHSFGSLNIGLIDLLAAFWVSILHMYALLKSESV